MDIKPIETCYKGFKFRSRLEARWAVFFDLARIKYEYEIDGYVLNNGEKYLPDFYLPDFKIYVEIKHQPTAQEIKDGIDEAWQNKCREFRSSVNSAILLVYGDPATDIWGKLYAWECDDGGGGEVEEYARFVPIGDDMYSIRKVIVLTMCNRIDELLGISPSCETNSNVINLAMMPDYYPCEAMVWMAGAMHITFDEKSSEHSFDWMRKKARQARFEYGEKG